MFYIDGRFIDREEEAKISILDLSILRGVGVFDYLRTYKKRPFHLNEHLHRFGYSARQVGLVLPHSLEEITKIAHHLIENTPSDEVSLKILLTGGKSPDQFTPQSPGNLILFTYPFIPPPQEDYSLGISVITTPASRALPSIKTLYYLPPITSLQVGKSQGAKEALYLNQQKEILEGSTSNFFGFRGNTLLTCSSDEILIGITREILLSLIGEQFGVKHCPVRYDELFTIEEAFLTSSSREIMPVVKIDSQTIGRGTPGPKTFHLMKQFREYTQQEKWPPLLIPRYAETFHMDIENNHLLNSSLK